MQRKRNGEAWGWEALRRLFGSGARAKVIAWICSRPPTPIVGAELARELRVPATAVGRELARLERLGMVEAGKLGRAKPYHLKESFPLLPGLRSMVLYATGIIAELRDRFREENDIEIAFIFGSLAAGDDRPESDVDALVVGDITGPRLSALIREAERATRRQVNDVHYSREEFARRVRQGGSFLPTVLDGPKVFLKGDEDALRKLAE